MVYILIIVTYQRERRMHLVMSILNRQEQEMTQYDTGQDEYISHTNHYFIQESPKKCIRISFLKEGIDRIPLLVMTLQISVCIRNKCYCKKYATFTTLARNEI